MRKTPLTLVLPLLLALTTAHSQTLEKAFLTPPEETKPWCYWYWFNGDIGKIGITKDLEFMSEIGINHAMIGMIKGGQVAMFSPEWYEATRHALREGNRLGVGIYMFNGPGWSQSGGPWVKPEQSMRRVIWNEFPAQGGAFSQSLRPKTQYGVQDIAVLAIPRKDTVSVTGKPTSANGKTLIRFHHTEPFAARSLRVESPTQGTLYAVKNQTRTKVLDFVAQKGMPKHDFLFDAEYTYSFNEIEAQDFEIELIVANEEPSSKSKKNDSPKEAAKTPKFTLSAEPIVAEVAEKQMGRLHPGPNPTWESYIHADTVEPKDTSTIVKKSEIINLTEKLDTTGKLQCTLPPGNWQVIYFGMTSTGKMNHPAPKEATGLEIDKMSREHTEFYFNEMFGKLLRDLTPEEKSAFKGITIDSCETGGLNWTDTFAQAFKTKNGYDPIACLPILTGRLIDSAKASDQFLWDLRRTVSDLIAENYVAGLKDMAHRNGLKLWCENYGSWGFPGEFSIYGANTDQIGGEFWTDREIGRTECRIASSTAHTYGHNRVYAEAFTSGIKRSTHPYGMKPYGDTAFADGINHYVFHVYLHQPTEGDFKSSFSWGQRFNRNTPWFREASGWMNYVRRCQYMLQQGRPVANVAVYIGDFAPQMTGPDNPVPVGYDYDFIGSDALLKKVRVTNGQWVIHDDTNPERIVARYQALMLPEPIGYLRPEVKKQLDALIAQGGKIFRGFPVTSDTLKQAAILPLVSETSGPVQFKVREMDNGRIFFLSSFEKTGAFEATLDITGKTPELFNPVTGETKTIARYTITPNGTRVTLDIKDPADSYFIVFRKPASGPSVVSTSGPSPDLDLSVDNNGQLVALGTKQGTYSFTLSDGSKRSSTINTDSVKIAPATPWKTLPTNNELSQAYSTTIELPAKLDPTLRYELNLGKVEVIARVTLNGKTYDTLWMPPFILDVTDALKPGTNNLSVQITGMDEKPTLDKTVCLQTRVLSVVK